MEITKCKLACAVSTALLISSTNVYAQSAEDEETASAKEGRIVITGRKKTEYLQESPMSISAFSSDDLEDSGVSDARDIADLTPGLQISGDFGRSSERPVIRGISNLRPETPQPVGLFIDGVYIRTGLISSILDNVHRVEVLKGPQSALYGRSTYGGVINYITKKPTDEFSGNLAVTYGQHGHTDITANFSGSFSDSVRASFGGRLYSYDGEYDNINPNTQGARGIGEESTSAVHAALNITPVDDLELNIRGYHSKDEDGQFAGYLFDSTFNNSVAGGGTECETVAISYFCGEAAVTDHVDIRTSINAGEDTTTFFGGLPAQWDMRTGLDREVTRITGDALWGVNSRFDLTWLWGYTSEETRIVTNQSYSPVLVGNSFAGLPFAFPAAWVTDDKGERDYYSHELRLSGELSESVNILAGVFFYNEDTASIDRDILQAELEFDGTSESKENKIFGLVEWHITDEISMTAELGRYEEKVATVTVASGADGDPLSDTFDGIDYRLTAAYQATEDTLFYGNIARGHKAGGFNSGVNQNDPEEADLSTYDEEVVVQYEMGVKSSFANGDGIYNIAFYALDLTDQQLSQVIILREGTPDQVQVTVVQNVGESEIQGIEAGMKYSVTDNFSIKASYALADTEIIEGTDATHGSIVGDESLVGFTIPRVSKHTGVLSGNYQTELSSDWIAKVKLDAIYASSRYAQVHNLQETGDSVKVNFRAGVENGSYELFLWADNLLDDDTAANVYRYVDPGDARFFARAHMAFLPRGRQVGLTARYKF